MHAAQLRVLKLFYCNNNVGARNSSGAAAAIITPKCNGRDSIRREVYLRAPSLRSHRNKVRYFALSFFHAPYNNYSTGKNPLGRRPRRTAATVIYFVVGKREMSVHFSACGVTPGHTRTWTYGSAERAKGRGARCKICLYGRSGSVRTRTCMRGYN